MSGEVFRHVRFWHLALAITAITFIVYAPSLRNNFVSFDDGILITRNPAVVQINGHTLRSIFTSYDPELYVPLTLFTYQLNHLIGGFNPFIYHLTNLLLHIANAILVFALAATLAKNRAVAFCCALLFALHPLNTEAVAWAAARKDVLSSFFFLLSFWLYTRFRETKLQSRYWLSVLFFAFGLLSKVSVIALPVVLILFDWKERHPWRRLLLDKTPYVALSAVFGSIAVYGKSQNLQSTGYLLNLLLASKSTVFYLWKMIVPWGFSVIYPQSVPVSILAPDVLSSIIVFALLLALCVYLLSVSKDRTVAFALSFYFLMLVPNYTNFYKNGFLVFASDRYAYLPSIGIFLLAAAALYALLREHRSLLYSVAAVILLSLGAVSSAQALAWRTSEALFRNVIRFYPSSAIAHNNLADELMKTNRPEEALVEINAALALDPSLVPAHLNKGSYFRQKVQLDAALEEYRAAVHSVEKKPRLTVDDIGAYDYLGELYEQMGRMDDALAQFRTAAEKMPDVAETHYNYGLILQKMGRKDDALAEFSSAVRLNPSLVSALYHLAGLLAEKGSLQEARAALERIIAIDPTYAEAETHLQDLNALLRQ